MPTTQRYSGGGAASDIFGGYQGQDDTVNSVSDLIEKREKAQADSLDSVEAPSSEWMQVSSGCGTPWHLGQCYQGV